MDPTQLTSVLAGVNIVLLSLLTAVWIRNYLTYRTSLLLGLIAFSAVLLVENLLVIYFLFTMQMLYAGTPEVQQAVLVLRSLQLLAVGFLTYVTLK